MRKFGCISLLNFCISLHEFCQTFCHSLLFHVINPLWIELTYFCQKISRSFLLHLSPFWIELSYYMTLSSLGYWALKATTPKTLSPAVTHNPSNLDIFFTSVSSATVSSMAAVEMEYFSNTQFIIITILMLFGGEIFTSMLALRFKSFKFPNHQLDFELGGDDNTSGLKRRSIKWLGYVVFLYISIVHISGTALLALYIIQVSKTSRRILANKSLNTLTFSAFTTVSTFSNCGFLPTNENMMAFNTDSTLLLILIPQALLGNTLYPVFLRILIWVLHKITKSAEFRYILKNSKDLGYENHLLPTALHSLFLAVTVFGFTLLQFALFRVVDWNSIGLNGLNSYQKFISALFQVVNTRHAGYTNLDLSTISPPILLLFIVMMYFPPYTRFIPMKKYTEVSNDSDQRKSLVQNLLFSPLSYLVIFIILICIIEKEKMMADPLNFNVLTISFEVVSAYGNVGLSTGYGCKRRLKAGKCSDAWYGFVGWWSNEAKVILILVMFFGRIKKYGFGGGKAWKLQ